MALTLEVPADYDATLPYFVPDPIDPVFLHRYLASSLPDGPVSSGWASELGTARVVSPIYGTSDVPSRSIVDSKPAVVFDGNDDLQNVGTLSTPLTFYLVFKPTLINGVLHTIVNMSGANIQISPSDVLTVGVGSGGATTTTALVSGQWYVAAVTISSTASTIDLNTEHVSAATTAGSLTRLTLANNVTGWGGAIREILVYGSVHTLAQRNAQIAAMKLWYGIA